MIRIVKARLNFTYMGTQIDIDIPISRWDYRFIKRNYKPGDVIYFLYMETGKVKSDCIDGILKGRFYATVTYRNKVSKYYIDEGAFITVIALIVVLAMIAQLIN